MGSSHLCHGWHQFLLDVAVEDDVVQDPAHVVFINSKNSYNTKPTVIFHFSTVSPFWLKPTVIFARVTILANLHYYHRTGFKKQLTCADALV
jgi:hypothetical protein